MLDDPRDMNRDLGYRDPTRDRYANLGEGPGYAGPLALLAIVLIIGGLIAFAPRGENTQTAQNSPTVERSVPPPAAPAPQK